MNLFYFHNHYLIFILGGCTLTAGDNIPNRIARKNIMKTSTMLYDQHLYTFGTEIDKSFKPYKYQRSFWKYDLSKDITIKNLCDQTTRNDIEFPSHVTPNLFTFGRLTGLPHILSMIQVDNPGLYQEAPEDLFPFYNYHQDNNTWEPVKDLVLRGPETRSGATITMTSNREELLVFGGFIIHPSDNQVIMTRQLYSFGTSKLSWRDETIKSIDSNIGSFSYHSATLVDNRYMIILGGISLPKRTLSILNSDLDTIEEHNRNSLSNVSIYDILEDKWEIKKVPMANKIFKFGHTATYIPSQQGIAVIGGASTLDGTPKSSTGFYFLSTVTWTWEFRHLLDTSGKPKKMSRAWHAAELVGDQLFLLHGLRNLKYTDKLAVIDVKTWSYTDNLMAFKPDPLLVPIEVEKDSNRKKIIIIVVSSILTCSLIIGLPFWYYLRRNKSRKLAAPAYHLQHLWADHENTTWLDEKIFHSSKNSQEIEFDNDLLRKSNPLQAYLKGKPTSPPFNITRESTYFTLNNTNHTEKKSKYNKKIVELPLSDPNSNMESSQPTTNSTTQFDSTSSHHTN